jgi:CubicO group peptidase (beta-lactamase class C family)
MSSPRLRPFPAFPLGAGLCLLLCAGAVVQPAQQQNRPLPVRGRAEPELAAFDRAMQQFMRERSIKAGTLAVMKGGRIVLARGYGYRDPARGLPLGPEAPLRLASVSKPITLAAVLKLIREGKLSLDTKVFVLLNVQPRRAGRWTNGCATSPSST